MTARSASQDLQDLVIRLQQKMAFFDGSNLHGVPSPSVMR
jgi:hypothetical protein